jgi:hypothetical protein
VSVLDLLAVIDDPLNVTGPCDHFFPHL